jgi:hypothetical protein
MMLVHGVAMKVILSRWLNGWLVYAVLGEVKEFGGGGCDSGSGSGDGGAKVGTDSTPKKQALKKYHCNTFHCKKVIWLDREDPKCFDQSNNFVKLR